MSLEDTLEIIVQDGIALRLAMQNLEAKIGLAPAYVNKTTAAKLCGVDPSYLRPLFADGTIPVVSFGGVERIMVESLLEYGRKQIAES